jgi:hypothetical protein
LDFRVLILGAKRLCGQSEGHREVRPDRWLQRLLVRFDGQFEACAQRNLQEENDKRVEASKHRKDKFCEAAVKAADETEAKKRRLEDDKGE